MPSLYYNDQQLEFNDVRLKNGKKYSFKIEPYEAAYDAYGVIQAFYLHVDNKRHLLHYVKVKVDPITVDILIDSLILPLSNTLISIGEKELGNSRSGWYEFGKISIDVLKGALKLPHVKNKIHEHFQNLNQEFSGYFDYNMHHLTIADKLSVF